MPIRLSGLIWRNGVRRTRALSVDIWAFSARPETDPFAWLAPNAMKMELRRFIFGFGQYSGLTLAEEALCVSVHLELAALAADELKAEFRRLAITPP